MLAGAFLGILISVGFGMPVLWIALGLAILSLIDDRGHLPVAIRLTGHMFAAALFVASISENFNLFLFLPLVIGIAWAINLYNFMDGSDGLAGGMTVFGFGTYAVAAGLQGHNDIGLLSLAIAAAAGGFLIFNFPPARIFMGDVGSISIGFLAAAVGLQGWYEGVWPALFPVVVFAPFAVDATVTLFRRALRRERVWKAHREHYYQRLILSGWSHRRVALAAYVLMLASALAGGIVVFAGVTGKVAAITTLALLFVVSMTMINRRSYLSRQEKGVTR